LGRCLRRGSILCSCSKAREGRRMFTVHNHVGRLIEVRMRPPVTPEELEDSRTAMEAILKALAPRLGVVVGDYAQVRVLRTPLANRLVEIFRHFSPQIERSGLLIGQDSAGSLLQMERVIRNANNPARKAFFRVDELKAWLHDVLSPRE